MPRVGLLPETPSKVTLRVLAWAAAAISSRNAVKGIPTAKDRFIRLIILSLFQYRHGTDPLKSRLGATRVIEQSAHHTSEIDRPGRILISTLFLKGYIRSHLVRSFEFRVLGWKLSAHNRNAFGDSRKLLVGVRLGPPEMTQPNFSAARFGLRYDSAAARHR